MRTAHENLGQRLRRLRKSANLTQIEVSIEVGIARSHLSKIEGSEYHPATWEIMTKLADLYNVSLDYLRFGDSIPENFSNTEIIKDRTEIALIRAFRVLNNDEKRALAILIDRRFAKSIG